MQCPEENQFSIKAPSGKSQEKNGFSMQSGGAENISGFHHTRRRQFGHTCPRKRVSGMVARTLPFVLKEREISVGRVNKIFASAWISDHQVAIGTKCNRLIAVDLNHGHQVSIPVLQSLPSNKKDHMPPNNSGIHSIAINPSQSLLATGAENPNNIGVYRLPTFDPVCVGQNCHKDWMFSVQWLDDQFLVAGSRDSQISLWSVSPELVDRVQERNCATSVPSYESLQPILLRNSVYGDKVRALEYSQRRKELASLSSNGFIHLWNLERGFRKIVTRRLPYCEENVCIALDDDLSLYAVGSQSHVSFLDARSGRHVVSVHSREKGSGVRSVSFRDAVLTVGTGQGALMFFDLTAGRFVETEVKGKTQPMRLCAGPGWLTRDYLYHQFFSETNHLNAIYTHQYDKSGTRLFVAGGPLPSGLSGNYAGLWQ
ncbi:DDB1- and CUL4-associated factor 12-A-like [Diadema antillarum]|uniref:DDB1- and CUL4-associated factor 12-A-like n=1 Tax=Diadema antillarum TaxID=105358 RepID=UPI003A8A3482